MNSVQHIDQYYFTSHYKLFEWVDLLGGILFTNNGDGRNLSKFDCNAARCIRERFSVSCFQGENIPNQSCISIKNISVLIQYLECLVKYINVFLIYYLRSS